MSSRSEFFYHSFKLQLTFLTTYSSMLVCAELVAYGLVYYSLFTVNIFLLLLENQLEEVRGETEPCSAFVIN